MQEAYQAACHSAAADKAVSMGGIPLVFEHPRADLLYGGTIGMPEFGDTKTQLLHPERVAKKLIGSVTVLLPPEKTDPTTGWSRQFYIARCLREVHYFQLLVLQMLGCAAVFLILVFGFVLTIEFCIWFGSGRRCTGHIRVKICQPW